MTAILDFLSAFAVAALSGLGVGGGGLMVLYLTALRKMEQIDAQGVNIIFFLCASAGAFILNRKKRRFDYKRVLILSLSGAAAAVGGALLSASVGNSLLSKLYGGLLVLSGIFAIMNRKDET